MADWLCDVVSGVFTPSLPEISSLPTIERSSAGYNYSHPTYPQPSQVLFSTTPAISHDRKTIHPSPPPIPEGFESAGAGRLVTFTDPQPLTSVIDRIAKGIGNPGGISVAIPQSSSLDVMEVRTVGICPGSGSSVLLHGDRNKIPDLIFTGELSHHDALAVIERGSAVVALFHSNTERGYLRHVMRQKLFDDLRKDWDLVEVDVSERDRDPYGIMVRQG